jgi:nitrous oxide reductase
MPDAEKQFTDPSRREFLKGVALVSTATLAAHAAAAGTSPDPQQKSASKESTQMRVLMPIGDATEVMDTLYPFFRLPEEGIQVVVAGPEARDYHGVMHEIPPDTRPTDLLISIPFCLWRPAARAKSPAIGQ